MGNCKFCGEPAGFLRSAHAACRTKHEDATIKVPELFAKFFSSDMSADRFHTLTAQIATGAHVTANELRLLAAQGIGRIIQSIINDHVPSAEEESRIVAVRNAFALSNDDIGEPGRQLVKVAILRDLDAGRVVSHVQLAGHVPINLEQNEIVLWIFNAVTYLTTKTRTQYVGKSQGVSFRIARGVYYRVGASKGEKIQSQYLSEEAQGDLIIATRNVYFLSTLKTIKLPAKKIVSILPYADAIQLTRDGVSAKPQVFKVDDPDFAANIIARLNAIDIPKVRTARATPPAASPL